MTITHWSKVGELYVPGEEPQIAPGVRGIVFDMLDGLYLPLILAEREGAGDVGRFLDALPKDRRIVFPNVVSQRLLGMLQRRGYRSSWDPEGECEVWERPALTT